uniref:Leucine rich repeats-containing protein n=1 Tax=Trepomonas sp. PC1 TaxID=1076344 RepID=A0A146KIS0_9EUKA|eukprot:JAP95149.1 Leucine rich repeats-containing protein [Trepomonas sp. PC1]
MKLIDKINEQLEKNKHISEKTLKNVQFDHKNIVFLDGIQQFPFITDICLQHNQIMDISALSQLQYIKKLNLSFNAISDINPIQNLQFLITLKLQKNKISDIQQLRYLQNLKYLDNCNLQDNTVVNQPGFKEYCLINLYNIGVLNFFSPSDDHLELWQCDTEVCKQKTLQLFQTFYNQQTNTLNISKNAKYCIDFAFFAVFPELRELLVSDVKTFLNIDILLRKPINSLRLIQIKIPLFKYQETFQLVKLQLDSMILVNLTFLMMFPFLEKLIINGCVLDSINGIKFCGQLNYLLLTSNSQLDLTELASCQNLKYLSVNRVKSPNFDFLSALQLEDLSLSDITIKKLPQMNCQSLSCVDFNSCSLKTIKQLQNCTKLSQVFLIDLKISETDELEFLLQNFKLHDLVIRKCFALSNEKLQFVNNFADQIHIDPKIEAQKLLQQNPFVRFPLRKERNGLLQQNRKLQLQFDHVTINNKVKIQIIEQIENLRASQVVGLRLILDFYQ